MEKVVVMLCQRCAQLARHLRVALFGPPRVKGNPEQMAALHIYSTERRRVRAEPVNRKESQA